MNGCKLSFFAQMQYYWRISQSYFYVNLYRKELCNNEFSNNKKITWYDFMYRSS